MADRSICGIIIAANPAGVGSVILVVFAMVEFCKKL